MLFPPELPPNWATLTDVEVGEIWEFGLLLFVRPEPTFGFNMKVLFWLRGIICGDWSVIEFKSRVGDRLAACFNCFYSSLFGFETFRFESYTTLPKLAALAAEPLFMLWIVIDCCWPKSASLLYRTGVPTSRGAGEELFGSGGIGTFALSEFEKNGLDMDYDWIYSEESNLVRFFKADPLVFCLAP